MGDGLSPHGTLDALAARLGAGERLAVAVSGGPDSLALLLLAARALPGRVTALTVDHGLRAEAAAEAAMVARVAAGLGVPHATLTLSGLPAANVQAAARAARYAAMRDRCAADGIGWLATAHHRDDQAETVAMRIARGAGVAGLAGIRRELVLGRGVTLVRPLLDVPRAALAAIVADARLTPAEDPSNRNPRFDRTRVRCCLAAAPAGTAPALAGLADRMADAEDALAWTADLAWAGRATPGEGRVTLDAAGLPRELIHRLVLRALATVAPAARAPRGSKVDRLVVALSEGRTATLGDVKCAPHGRFWRFAAAPARQPVAGVRRADPG